MRNHNTRMKINKYIRCKTLYKEISEMETSRICWVRKKLNQLPIWRMNGNVMYFCAEILKHFLPELKWGHLCVSPVCHFKTVEKKTIMQWHTQNKSPVWKTVHLDVNFAIWKIMTVKKETVPKDEPEDWLSLSSACVLCQHENEEMAQAYQPGLACLSYCNFPCQSWS